MKKVIILSCSMGQGHNSCAQAVKEYFEEQNIRCDIVNSMEFISRAAAGFMSWGHSFMYKNIPGLFKWGYRFNEKHPALLEKGSVFYKFLTSGAGRMYEYIKAGGYDTAICTHVFPSIILTRLLERHPMDLMTAYVDTDYTFSPGTETGALAKYFVPCRELLGEFQDRIPAPHETVVSGIPVKREFLTCRDREEAKRALGIHPEHRHLLMMSGSMGCGPMVKLLRRISEETSDNVELTVICGTNKRLLEKLTRRYGEKSRVHIVGYTEEVSLYMDSADLYLTKPGGISVTEAAAKDLPMVFVNPVSGCEKYNMDFYTGMGAAVTEPSVDGLAQKCIALLSSDNELLKMRGALEKYGQPDGARLIFDNLTGGEKRL